MSFNSNFYQFFLLYSALTTEMVPKLPCYDDMIWWHLNQNIKLQNSPEDIFQHFLLLWPILTFSCHRCSRSHHSFCHRGGRRGYDCVCLLHCISLLPHSSPRLHLESPWKRAFPIKEARRRSVGSDIVVDLSPHPCRSQQDLRMQCDIQGGAAQEKVQAPQSQM